MNSNDQSYYELRFQVAFLEATGSTFEDLFVSIMSKAHPADFVACRPWGRMGDRKNDGYLKSERTLFQVYAPSEIAQATTIRKIEEDFSEALPHWQKYFDVWVFVHNARKGLPPAVLEKLLELERDHAPIRVFQWGFDELLSRFRRLSQDSLRSLYGSPPNATESPPGTALKRKRELARESARRGDYGDARQNMLEALAIARTEGNESEEVEVLAGLALLASSRRPGRGDVHYFLEQAAKKADKLKSSVSKVIYLRAQAKALIDEDDVAGAEEAFRKALGHCLDDPDDEKGNLATQACIVQASFVHFLCQQGRLDEAREVLTACEDNARRDPDAEEGELLEAALEAGIHVALDIGDVEGAKLRIREFEELATSAPRAARVGGDLLNVANQASHRKMHEVAIAAARASVHLGRQCYDPSSPSFLVGAMYTEAMVLAQAGHDEEALSKVQVVPALCTRPEDAPIKQAAHQLIAEIRRSGGDAQAAVDMARRALQSATGEPENIAFSKAALARALNDNGETEEALKEVSEAIELLAGLQVPPRGLVDFLSQQANYASQLGAEEQLALAVGAIEKLPDEPHELQAEKERALARTLANQALRKRFVDILEEEDSASIAGSSGCDSLQEANATVMTPLLRLWEDWPECATGFYDFWGRGNFGRLLRNARSFPNTLNITIEVRSLEDVKRAIRLWGLYADFLILLWKGSTTTGIHMIPFPADYEDPGGWGYTVAAGDVLKKEGSTRTWHPALTHISALPEEIVAFLASEGRPFIEAGRLVVVPAVGAGCVSPGHGPFEQLLAEAGNALPTVNSRGIEGVPIGLIPHSPDAPVRLVAEVAESEASTLRRLRLLLLKRTQQLRPDRELGREAKYLALEIEDALRDLESRQASLVHREGFHQFKEPLKGTTAPFRSSGRSLSDAGPESPYAPLLILQNLGYGWRVEGPQVMRLPPRFEPREGDVIGTWLAPPTPGWGIPTVKGRVS